MMKLEFPALVEQRQSGYCLQPLLMPGISVTRHRYGDAVRSLQNTLRKDYSNIEVNDAVLNELLWYSYSPDVKFEILPLSMKSGIRYVEGHFCVVSYNQGGHRYICLPKLGHLTVRVSSATKSENDFTNFVTDTVTWFFRELRKENAHLNYSYYFSRVSDSYITVNTTVETKQQSFPFEYDPTDFFAMLGNTLQFDGAEELSKVAEDMATGFPDLLEEAYYRQKDTDWLYSAIFEGKPQAIALVGPDGIGKSNLVQHTLNTYLQRYRSSPIHKLQKVWLLDPLRVISGMSIVGQWERRFESILERIRDRLRDITNQKVRAPDILFVSNPVALLRIGKSAQTSLTLSHLLKPYLERRDISIILEATPEEWQKVQELDRSFADFFQVQRLKPLDTKALNRVYTRRKAQLERHYECRINSKEMLTLLKTEPGFRGNHELPGSVIGILKNLAVRNQRRTIKEEDVYQAIQNQFHIRKEIIDRHTVLKRSDVLAHFESRLIGQVQACNVLTDTVMSIKAKLTQAKKPLNTMIFIGPTGVGKTESVKQLASYLFDRDECLVRIDMNEFADEYSVERLIGSRLHPQGILTEQVRYIKACVLLLDEIEKAHPRVHDLLLQLLDDGRLTDAMGTTTDFTQCIIVMTSNIGSQEASSGIGFQSAQQQNHSTYQKALERFFRPELINRINQTVVFEPLKQSNMEFLAQLHLKKLLQRDGFVRRKTILNIDSECLTELAKGGYDPNLGARALKRHMERSISHMISASLASLTGNVPIILHVDLEDNKPKIHITQLVYATPVTHELKLDKSSLTTQDYMLVSDSLDQADECLSSLAYGNDQDKKYLAWSLITLIRDLNEPLRSYIWEREEKEKIGSLQIALPFKSRRIRPNEHWRSAKVDTAALFAHSDMNDYLNQIYHRANETYSIEDWGQLQLLAETKLLCFAADTLSKRGIDRGTLIISKLSNGSYLHVHYLVHQLERKIADIAQIDQHIHNPHDQTLEISGCGIHEILSYESGIHLFLEDYGVQIPILVRYYPSGHAIHEVKDFILQNEQLNVLRLYSAIDSGHTADGCFNYHITDLRLGLMSDSDIQSSDSNVLIYPALIAKSEQVT